MGFLKKKLKLLGNYCLWLNRSMNYGRGKLLPRCENKILIIGNGPSAKRIDFDYYSKEGYDFLCVNHYASNSELFFKIKPKYYCCVEPRIMSTEHDQYEDSRIKLFSALNKVDWPMTFICCVGDYPAINNPNIEIVKINKAVYDSDISNRVFKLYQENKATCGYQNVIAAALFYSISVKASEILLTGVESDMHRELIVDKDNNIYREYVHFYGTEKKNVVTDGQIKKGELFTYFYWTYKTFYQYSILAKYANYCRVSIKNMCVNSFIDVFEKIEAKEKK